MDAVTDYATLIDAIPGMLKRDGDVQITSNAALFVQLAEADLYDLLLLRDEETEATLATVQSSAVIALPSNYISPIALWIVIDGERRELRKVQPQELPYDTDNTQPAAWAIDGSNIRFDCPADAVYTVYLRYVGKTTLSQDVNTNYLLVRRPDVYLYACLKQACLFTEDDDGARKYDGLLSQAVNSMKQVENRSKRVPMRTDLPGTYGRSDIFRGD